MLYLTADGGGTKLVTLLFDDQLRLISSGISGGTNTNFRPPDAVLADMQAAVDACVGDSHPVIENAVCVIVGPTDEFLSCVRRRAELKQVTPLGEGSLSLAAGAGVQYGVLALAGTGSDVFMIQPGYHDTIGGWGTVLGDEGGGYDLGVAALRAAIYAEDGRGEATALLPLIKEKWKLHELWEIVPIVYGSSDQRRLVASVSHLVERAAAMGDAVALSLYEKAAHELAHMTVTILDRHRGEYEGPIVVSGGVWKGSPLMFDAYRREVLGAYPHAEVVMPMFDPVVGGVVWQAFANGMKKEQFWDALRQNFGQYLYQKPPASV